MLVGKTEYCAAHWHYHAHAAKERSDMSKCHPCMNICLFWFGMVRYMPI